MFYQVVIVATSLLTMPAIAKVSLQMVKVSPSQTIKLVRPVIDNSNPLWQEEARFAEIKPRHITEGLADLKELVDGNIELSISDDASTFEEIYLPLEEILVATNLIRWRYVSHLQRAVGGDQWQKVYQEVTPELVKLEQKVSQNQSIYHKLNDLAASDELSEEQRRIIELRLQSVELGGIRLLGEQQERFNDIENELALLSNSFINNVRNSIAEFHIVLTEQGDITGLPTSFLQLASANYRRLTGHQSQAETGPWALTIDYPSYSEFMKHSTNRTLREKLYRAEISIASAQPFDNSPVINKVLKLRKEKAQLLGFQNHAELSLATKMADNVEQVEQFLGQLHDALYPVAQQEYEELLIFAKENGAEQPLQH